MANRLINEKSPYLLQHAHNPVNWYPWCAEAFAEARRSKKPIFLSVGYATCHWCHVMEKETFEDPEAAAALNGSFVCIKVDREERPDIDAVYMAACQLVTGSGGWPLTIIMTPEKKPFFAGTYIPKLTRPGRLGILDLCSRIDEIAKATPERITQSADAIVAQLDAAFRYEAEPHARPDQGLLDRAVEEIVRRFDPEHGGFDTAPKFPTPQRLLFLLNSGQRNGDERILKMVVQTLTAMRRGGIWDHVGFGFHRYATDNRWLLPHFEKMLYDQAWLTMAYGRAFEITGDKLLGQTTREIITYVLRDMTSAEGGFHAAEDADSEGEEGKFYLWSLAAFASLAEAASPGYPWDRIFNLTAEGNFREEATGNKTGTNIVHLGRTLEQWAAQLELAPEKLADGWEVVRQALFEARAQRIRPLKDDKILTDWNGMMIAALAQAGRILQTQAYVAAAVQAAGFLLDRLRDAQGRLLHRFREGRAAISATANDYAGLIMGLIELFKTTRQTDWLEQAVALQKVMDTDFWDQRQGGYRLSIDLPPEHVDALPALPKELYDGAMPSANAMALNNLFQLADLRNDAYWRTRALEQLAAFAGSVKRQPAAFTHTLNGWHLGIRLFT